TGEGRVGGEGGYWRGPHYLKKKKKKKQRQTDEYMTTSCEDAHIRMCVRAQVPVTLTNSLAIFGLVCFHVFFCFFSSRRRHTRFKCDWSSDVCSSDLPIVRMTGAMGKLAAHDLTTEI